MTSPKPESNRHHLLTLLGDFVRAQTSEEAGRLLRKQPDLLSDDVDALLGEAIESVHDEQERRLLLDRRVFLNRCREVGVDAALAEVSGESSQKGARYDLESILRELDQPVSVAGMPRRLDLCRRALSLVDRAMQRSFWADLQNQLAIWLTESDVGDRAENLEEAIAACREALKVRTREVFAVDWAETTGNLARAYENRVRGNEAENLERAIQGYREALEIFTRQTMPAEWARTMMNLANAYAQRRLGNQSDNLEQAIDGYEQALEVRTRGTMPVAWARTTMNLANAYFTRLRGDRADNLERAITGYEQGLEVLTPQTAVVNWTEAMNNLAHAYRIRIRGNRAENDERGIAICKEVLGKISRQTMPLKWSATMNNLAACYLDRIRGDRAENVELALAAYQQSLEVSTLESKPLEWTQTMTGLARAYEDRIRGDRAENLEQAIKYCQQALKVMTRDSMPLEWARITTILANVYSDRIRGDRAENLEWAIEAYRQVLDVVTRREMPAELTTKMNLGTAYEGRIHGDPAENVEDAIKAYHDAPEVRTRHDAPLDWAVTMLNLANAYSDRRRGDRSENLERAIETYQQVLEVMTREAQPTRWAQTLSALAYAYTQATHGDRAMNLERSIDAAQRALEVRTREAAPMEWATTMAILGLAYERRIRGDRAENLERAIEAHQRALDVNTRDTIPQEWAATMSNLANAWGQRIRGDREENLERAINTYNESLQVLTRQTDPTTWALTMNCLGLTYQKRIGGNRAYNVEQAIDAYGQALQVSTREADPCEWARTMMNCANAYSERICGNRAENVRQAIDTYQQSLEVTTRESMPAEHRLTQINLGNLLFTEQRWTQASTAYQQALSASELLYQLAATPESRQAELREVRWVPANLAYSLAKAGNTADAVVELEKGRAQAMAEALALDRAPLEQLPSAEREAFDEIRARIRDLQAKARLAETTRGGQGFLSISQELHDAYKRLEALIARIRRHVPGFLPKMTPQDVWMVASVAPLVYVVATRLGGMALIIRCEHPAAEVVWLPELTDDKLSAQLTEYFSAYAGRQRAHEAWLSRLDSTSRWLWTAAVGAIIDALAPSITATFIPVGWLGLLPLHAAWRPDPLAPTGRHYALDSLMFSYVPSARALSAARKTVALADPDSLLVVDEPQPVRGSPLPNSAREVETAVAAFAKHQVFKGREATREAVLRGLDKHSVLHFSCHAYANLDHPLQSGLAMANDQVLSLGHFLDQHLHGLRLAVLSACETGMAGNELPDEVISLPSGLMQAGAAGVAASLWSVSDVSTMMLMARFYEAWRAEKMEPPEALRTAQRWIRDTTNEEKKNYFKDSLPEFASDRMPQETANELFQKVVLSDPGSRDFAHPYHWAAFTYVGM